MDFIEDEANLQRKPRSKLDVCICVFLGSGYLPVAHSRAEHSHLYFLLGFHPVILLLLMILSMGLIIVYTDKQCESKHV